MFMFYITNRLISSYKSEFHCRYCEFNMKKDLQFTKAIRRDAAVISLAVGWSNQRPKSGQEGGKGKAAREKSSPKVEPSKL